MTEHHRTAAWSRVTRLNRPRIKATLPAPCVQPRCQLGGLVYPEQRWDVAHIIDVTLGGTDSPENLGPGHTRCNRSDGGKAGAKIATLNRRTDRRLLPW